MAPHKLKDWISLLTRQPSLSNPRRPQFRGVRFWCRRLERRIGGVGKSARKLSALTLLLGAVAACDRTPAPLEKGPARAKATQSSHPTSQASAPKATPLALPIDLLRVIDAELVVSSYKDASSRAESLVDGRTESAWRPNPPDPAPWVETALPVGASIQKIELFVAGTKPGIDPGALSVAVFHDGREIGLMTAQDQRLSFAPQGPWQGGRVRLAWKSKLPRGFVGFTQLSIWGEADPTLRLPEATPFAHVQGSPPAPSAWWLAAPYPSLKALCAKYHQLRAARPEEASQVDGKPPTKSRCELEQTLKPTGQPPPGVARAHIAVVTSGPDTELGYSPVFPKLLVIETDRGWFPSDLIVDTDRGTSDSRAGVAYVTQVVSAGWVDGRLELDVFSRLLISGGYPPDGPANVAGRFFISCDVKSKPVCREGLIAYGDRGSGSSLHFRLQEANSGPEVKRLPERWEWERAHFVAPSGNLRLGDCLQGEPGKQVGVPCFAPDASRLR